MAERTSYFNGEFLPDSECRIHMAHRGILRGDTVYDATRTFNGKIFRLRDHLDRLQRSLTFARIDLGLSSDELDDIINEVVSRNESLREPGGDHIVWQSVTRGYASTLARINEPSSPILYVSVMPLNFGDYARDYETGGHVVFPRTRSYSNQSLEPKLKHFSRMNFSLAELETVDVDPEAYPVLLDVEGNISENVGGNFFIVTDGVLRTPGDRDILQGISRKVVLELADQLGIPTSEEDLQPYDAYTADEAFLSSSGYCILPVGRIDNRSTKGDAPGPITQRLLAAWSEMVGVDIVDQALQYA